MPLIISCAMTIHRWKLATSYADTGVGKKTTQPSPAKAHQFDFRRRSGDASGSIIR